MYSDDEPENIELNIQSNNNFFNLSIPTVKEYTINNCKCLSKCDTNTLLTSKYDTCIVGHTQCPDAK